MAAPKKITTCKNKIAQDATILSTGKGSSNRLRQLIIWVVNKNGLITSNDFISNIPIMVKMIIIAITVTIGVMELSIIHDSNVLNEATTLSDKNAIRNAKPQRQLISSARMIVKPSLFIAIKSPTPKIARETNKAKMPNTNRINYFKWARKT